MKKPSISITKISLANTKVNFKWKEIFTSFSKGLLLHVTGSNISAIKESISAFKGLSLSTSIESIAYEFILSSLVNATHDLILEFKSVLNLELAQLESLISSDDYVAFLDSLSDFLKTKKYSISLDNLRHPESMALTVDFKKFLRRWLKFYIVSDFRIENIINRFDSYFVFALFDTWKSNPAQFGRINEALNNPLSQSVNTQLEWNSYYQYLIKSVEEPIFDENFGLKSIYVSLNGYYNSKIVADDFKSLLEGNDDAKRCTVVDLHENLLEWINSSDINNDIKVISGGPGSGKSSFIKMLLHDISKSRSKKVILIPMHLLNVKNNLVDSIGEYLHLGGYFSSNIVNDVEFDSEPLLIVFDGLDELSGQGKIGESIARDFVRQVERLCQLLNRVSQRVKVLLSGREIVVQSISSDFRREGQIIHLLPYLITDNSPIGIEYYHKDYELPKNEGRTDVESILIDIDETVDKPARRARIIEKYHDPSSLLKEDKRLLWWNKYLKLKQFDGITEMPDELKLIKLNDITAQPLLNYLVALSFERGVISFDESTNINEIYYDLILGVHNRAYEQREYSTIKGITPDNFIRILEEIAISSWKTGAERNTTTENIIKHLKSGRLESVLNNFIEGAQTGVTKLLTAFYFRQTGVDTLSPTFEFTHKSFGEYLTARKIVRGVKNISDNYTINQRDFDLGWDENVCLDKWIYISSNSQVSSYIKEYILNELMLLDKKALQIIKASIENLFVYNVKKYDQFLEGKVSLEYSHEQFKNTIINMFVIVNCCSIVTKSLSNINWIKQNEFGFSDFIKKFSSTRKGPYYDILYTSCSWNNLDGSKIYVLDLYGADLSNSSLKNVEFHMSILNEANLQNCIIENCDFWLTQICNVNFKGVTLKNNDFNNTVLQGAYFEPYQIDECDFEAVFGKLRDDELKISPNKEEE